MPATGRAFGMNTLWILIQVVLLVPVFCGSLYCVLCILAAEHFLKGRHRRFYPDPPDWPPVTILRPIYGLDKDLEASLRSACTQDYPVYQVVASVQRMDDPALPILRHLADEFGEDRITIVAVDSEPVFNGKIQNLQNALQAARYDVLVISDSDVRLQPDYLKAIVRPLQDPTVGYVCTVYRAVRAETWHEKLELLSLNADFMISIVFAEVTGASDFCLGPSVAFRRSGLELIGGFEALSEYLVEDYELGRRLIGRGYRMILVPHFVEVIMDLAGLRQWWDHQLYWDLNTRSARPWAYFMTVLTRSVPFAVMFALVRLFDPVGLLVLLGALGVRLGSAALMLSRHIEDREGLRALALLPLRDLAGFAIWLFALFQRTVVWRGREFRIAGDGRILTGGEDR
ncbi:MAG: glycosyltransferase [Alphaproteobacteria bacterium]|nr:glycosyltransferase [Alphaproteobacteria bacterium]